MMAARASSSEGGARSRGDPYLTRRRLGSNPASQIEMSCSTPLCAWWHSQPAADPRAYLGIPRWGGAGHLPVGAAVASALSAAEGVDVVHRRLACRARCSVIGSGTLDVASQDLAFLRGLSRQLLACTGDILSLVATPQLCNPVPKSHPLESTPTRTVWDLTAGLAICRHRSRAVGH